MVKKIYKNLAILGLVIGSYKLYNSNYIHHEKPDAVTIEPGFKGDAKFRYPTSEVHTKDIKFIDQNTYTNETVIYKSDAYESGTVLFKNESGHYHDVTFDEHPNLSVKLQQNETKKIQFEKGTYEYYCTPHSWEDESENDRSDKRKGMVGTIIVY